MIPGSASVLVISDSHGNVPALTEVLAWAEAGGALSGGAKSGDTGELPPLSTAVFLGDGADDLAPASARAGFTLSWNIVRGNVDVMSFSLPGAMLLEITGSSHVARGNPAARSSQTIRKLFLTHGNAYNVGEGFKTLAAAARTNNAEAALFGHTHVPHCEMLDGILLLNPGSIGRPRSKVGPTFAVLECPPVGPLSARFFGLAKRGKKVVPLGDLEL